MAQAHFGLANMDVTFSENLFWDADPKELDLQRHRKYVVQRVLERGSEQDIRKAFDYYGFQTVVDTAKSLRTLEPQALSFIAGLANEPREDFRCCAEPQQAPWI